jgi:hypothetical protein
MPEFAARIWCAPRGRATVKRHHCLFITAELADVYLKYGIRMVMAPVPISLPLPLRSAIPVDVFMVPSLPIHMPSTIFMFIKIVVILVMLIVDVVPLIMVIIAVPIVVPIAILRQQTRRDEQRGTQREYQECSCHCV